MADRIITLARFTSLMDAQLAKIRLEAEGISVQLTGELSGGPLPGMELSFGDFQLPVTDDDLHRASAVLAADEAQLPEMEEEEEDIPASTDIRPQGSGEIRPVRADEPPASSALRSPSRGDEPAAKAPGPPAEEAPIGPAAEDNELEEKVRRSFTWTAEERASRAFRAAVVGLLLMAPFVGLLLLPIVGVAALLPTVYSVWLLARIAMLPEEVSASAMRRVYGALATNAATLVIAAIYYRPLLDVLVSAFTGAF